MRLCHPTATLALVLALAASGCTPNVGEPVALTRLFTDAKLHGKYAAVTGLLEISTGIMGSTTCKAGTCNLRLAVDDPKWKPPTGALTSVSITLDVGSGENRMAELPDKYSKKDLKVKAMGGKTFAAGDRVKLSGNLRCHGNNGEDSLPCSMRVDRVDPP